MAANRLVVVFTVLGLFGIVGTSHAQNATKPKKTDKTLLDRLDDFGKAIFGGQSPSENDTNDAGDQPGVKSSSRAMPRKPSAYQSPRDLDDRPEPSVRAGSILAGTGANPSPAQGNHRLSDDLDDLSYPADHSISAKPRASTVPDQEKRKPAGGRSLFDLDDPPGFSDASKPAEKPMYERLSAVRRSDSSVGKAAPQFQQRPSHEPEIVKPSAAPEPHRAKTSERAAAVKPVRSGESENGVLFSRKGPILSVETAGPRTIVVGKESTYEVHLANSGETAAEELVVYVSLPDSADVAGIEATAGVPSQSSGTVLWKLIRLDAKQRERLTLRIIPRQSRAFDLAVCWESKPVVSQAMIEVQEPKLFLQLDGPREVLYGKREIYRLKLSNAGTGAADNVLLKLQTAGTGENAPAEHRIAVLPAGAEKTLDVELTARQAGNLTIQVEAQADGVRAELSETVLVRRANLQVEIEGPKFQYLGAPTAYVVRVRNTGTAPVQNVRLSLGLPAGAEYLSGIERAMADDSGGKVDWMVESLGPNQMQTATVQCRLAAAGTNRVQVHAEAEDDLRASVETATQVESIANLVMDLQSPEGPVPVGQEAVYELRIRNRGTREAENIEVFAYLSNGIEPTATDGGPGRVGSGQVVFQPLRVLAPGAEAVLKVRARADVAGNHIFRAEAHCKPLGTRLVNEVTNLYYPDDPSGAKNAQTSVQKYSSLPDPMRIGKRPASPSEQAVAPPWQ